MYLQRALKLPKTSFFLLGPRGTGKSTWLRHVLPDARWFDLLSEELYHRLMGAPGAFAGELRALPNGSWVVVDEIQRLPSLLNEVHRFIEEKRLRFALCGSSARKLKRAGVNLLGGRAPRRAMHPFLPGEIGPSFDLPGALRHGLLPMAWAADDKDECLKAYSHLYLKEEIQAEALVRNLPGFVRFLPLAALLHSQVVNVANLAREAGVARTTVSGHMEILEETLLCFRLPAYEARLRVRERKLPKWYWCDPGIARAMKGVSGPVAPEERGALFEGLVAQTIRAYRDYRRACDEFFYWAPGSGVGVEVDFLLVRDGRFAAIEVKSGKAFSDGWCKGLRAIASLAGLRRRLAVYPEGPVMRTEDGIDVLPFVEFARLLEENRLWP
ncbi:MAG: DUF4143 domain-containing protein [Candidatus Sumerlaeota bacterium]|nr:DUF4143 domain-containing protein [Candidatus Sumerlaeota bacterium]